MKEMIIESIRVSLDNYQRVVILKEREGERYLPIWIGPAEADAITIKIQGMSMPRPMTHDLINSVIGILQADINSVLINDLANDTFYGKVILNVAGEQKEVDSRPSDALALAIRAEVPIFAEDTVLDKAGLLIDEATGKAIPQETAEGKSVSEDELKRMSAFTDFIDTLDMEDFDRGKGENE
jgi:bifunctional DNase/RNase